jgi:hypothetical protein
VTGGVLAWWWRVFSLRELDSPRTQVWTVWTNTALAMLGLLAIALWVSGTDFTAQCIAPRRDRAPDVSHTRRARTVLDAARRFESATSGEIRVHLAEHSRVSRRSGGARVREARHDAHAPAQRRAVLCVGARPRVACIGDAGIHQKVQEIFWDGVVRAIERRLCEGRLRRVW